MLWLLWCNFGTSCTEWTTTWMYCTVTLSWKKVSVAQATDIASYFFFSQGFFFHAEYPTYTDYIPWPLNILYIFVTLERESDSSSSSFFSIQFSCSCIINHPAFYSALKALWKAVVSSPMNFHDSTVIPQCAKMILLTSVTKFHCLWSNSEFICPLFILLFLQRLNVCILIVYA